MELSAIIESAEIQYKQILEDFFISFYDERLLPSHGIDHHRRVWIYSKELLSIIPLNSSTLPKLVPELIIASYLHDIGMSVDSGVKHGKHSSELCIRFLRENNFQENDFADVLNAIECHDNKDYSDNSNQDDLLKILSVSDDLDAFGIAGIYRYAEIYLTRGVSYESLGIRIIENAEKRFRNFLEVQGLNVEFIEKHRLRYEVLTDFFAGYNEQLKSYSFGSAKPAGYCGVIELIADMVKNKLDLNDLFYSIEKYKEDPIIRWFFLELKKEFENQ
jgi:HD superfamily phosphodiesterase